MGHLGHGNCIKLTWGGESTFGSGEIYNLSPAIY